MALDSMLNQCRENFGGGPRHFSLWDRLRYLDIRKPFWLWVDEDDALYDLIDHREEIFRLGVVDWGYVVQANAALWEHGKGDHPVDVVFYDPGSGWQDTEYLAELAEHIYALKETTPDSEDLALLSQHMKDDVDRAQGLKVPASLSGGRQCSLTTTFINRRHLAARMLCNGLLPIVVSETDPSKVLTLPERYWPADFREWWLGPHVDESHMVEAPWHNRLIGGLFTALLSMVFGWLSGNAVFAVATGEQALNLFMAGVIVGPLLVAAWLLTLSYRMFTGRGRRSDRGLIGPWTLLVFSAAITGLGAFVLYSMWAEFEWKPALGGILITVLGVKGMMLARKRL